MSVYLDLLFLDNPNKLQDTSVLCYERLTLDQDYRVLGQLIDLSQYRKGPEDEIPAQPTIKTTPIPPQLWLEVYGDRGTIRTRQNVFGEEVSFAYAEQLRRLKMPHDASPKNLAIKAFLDALPNDTPIFLWPY